MVKPKPLVLVMDVCGCGKSTMGDALANALGTGFLEGDRLHPPENVTRMQAGIPLTDEDREGWLMANATEIQAAARAGTGLVGGLFGSETALSRHAARRRAAACRHPSPWSARSAGRSDDRAARSFHAGIPAE